jgi:drug/metabolite transporter (DMT)-like permease
LWTGLPAITRGILLMLVSTLAFSLMHALIRYVSADLHALQIAFFRNLFGAFVILPWFLRYGLAPLRTGRFGLHVLRACLNVGAMICFFTALSLTPIAQVTALGFSAPIFAAVLSVLLLREVVRLRRWSAILIGFLGTLVILRPGFETVDVGSLLTLLSSLLWGFTLIVIRVLGRSESSLTTTSYMVILLTLLSLGPALFVWQTPTPTQLAWLVLIGVLGTSGQFMVAQSLKEAETGVVMPFDFFKLIWSSMLGYLMFAEVPHAFIWLGGAMIFSASTYIAYRETQIARAEADEAAERARKARFDGPT